MRSEEEIYKLILTVAKAYSEIKAVALNGSRADKNIAKDDFQDYDICFVVTGLSRFTKDHSWVDVFGERLIQQLPDEMMIGERSQHSFAYLMLFKDGSRIDITLLPLSAFHHHYNFKQSSVVLLDKDGLFNNINLTTSSMLIMPPSQKEFTDCCNEFWWVSTYVVKGVCRNELIYAKQMLEGPVRSMLQKMLQWFAGLKTNFTAISGYEGKYLGKQLPADVYNQLLATYSDCKAENICASLLKMAELFSNVALQIAVALSLTYNMEEERNVRAYFKKKLLINRG